MVKISESFKKQKSINKNDKKAHKKKAKEKIKSVFYLHKNVEVIDYDFDNYVECGTRIDLSFAIDFTISNGNLMKGEPSLHSLDQNQKNVYTAIIEAIGKKFESI